MALSSQVNPHPVLNRYAASRKRWPWLALALVVVLIGGLYHLSASDSWSIPIEPVAVIRPPNFLAHNKTHPEFSFSVLSTTNRAVSTPLATPGSQLPMHSHTRSSQADPDTSPMPRPTEGSKSTRSVQLSVGLRLLDAGEFVEGRRVLSELFFSKRRLSAEDRQVICQTLGMASEQLIFSRNVQPTDPVAEYYQIQPGDMLSVVAPRYKVPHTLVGNINKLDPNQIVAGERIKLIKGPFHGRVIKSAYRMDVYLVGPDGLPLLVKSYRVGLGKEDSTPLGKFQVGGKITNPDWRNPETYEYYPASAPDNPIGEHWISMNGVEDQTKDLKGYGLHGTIDPESIGKQASMGCVRLLSEDIEQVYHLFMPGQTTIEILP